MPAEHFDSCRYDSLRSIRRPPTRGFFENCLLGSVFALAGVFFLAGVFARAGVLALAGLLVPSGAASAEMPESDSSEPAESNAKAPDPEPKRLEFDDGRAIPGKPARKFPHSIYESIQPIESSASDFIATPDRWRMFYQGKLYDPYNQNVLKGDIPVFGSAEHPWFLEVSAISDSMLERRKIPVPVGNQSTSRPRSNDALGDGDQTFFNQNLVLSLALINGNTSFKPQELEFRFTPVFNLNYVDTDEDGLLRADPTRGSNRQDGHIGFQDLFADIHLANLSERYDFISTRIGIQQFISDFRGFIYNSSEPGVRFFGNYDDNHYQYNLAYFSRLDKDTNSGLNTTFNSRNEDVVIGNVFWQDLIALGHTTQANIVYRQDNAGDEGFQFDSNGFLVRPASIGDLRPKNVSSTYFGLTGDGHIGRVNTTTALYYVTGSESHNEIAQRDIQVSAAMAAQELSYDIDWIRLRTSVFWASGDANPYDGKGQGFDTVVDSPNFAGGDLSFWQRQGIPLIGGGVTNLTNRNSLVPSFRPGKEKGQANFVNPGLRLYNVGVDFDILPELKLINNASYLQFDRSEALEAVRQDGSIDRDIGWDLSTGLLYRPFLNNNVQFRAGTAFLLPGEGMKNLFGDDVLYDAFTNMILQY